jgi:hypothetical protein
LGNRRHQAGRQSSQRQNGQRQEKTRSGEIPDRKERAGRSQRTSDGSVKDAENRQLDKAAQQRRKIERAAMVFPVKLAQFRKQPFRLFLKLFLQLFDLRLKRQCDLLTASGPPCHLDCEGKKRDTNA